MPSGATLSGPLEPPLSGWAARTCERRTVNAQGANLFVIAAHALDLMAIAASERPSQPGDMHGYMGTIGSRVSCCSKQQRYECADVDVGREYASTDLGAVRIRKTCSCRKR